MPLTATHTRATWREHVMARLWTQPLQRCDAIVLYTGDGETRVPPACEAFRMGVAPVLLFIGGFDEPPYAITADRLLPKAHAQGIAPDRVRAIVEHASNTAECARALVRECRTHGWKRVMLVVSPYHVPRAFLTTVRALDDANLADVVSVTMLAGSATRWDDAPMGCADTRAVLFDREMAKVAEYAARGDCATWARGLAYLHTWEAR